MDFRFNLGLDFFSHENEHSRLIRTCLNPFVTHPCSATFILHNAYTKYIVFRVIFIVI